MALLDVLSLDRITDSNGDPVAGAEAFVYFAGTTTPVATYSDDTLISLNTFPIVADANGVFGPVYVPSETYKVSVRTPGGVTLYEADDVEVTPAGAFATTGLVSYYSSTSIVGEAQLNGIIVATDGITLALGPAATLRNGFKFEVLARGGAVILNPAADEQINGVDSISVPDGFSARVFCDGTEWLAQVGGITSNLVPQSRVVASGLGLTGGGDLSADRTLSVALATQAEVTAGTASDKLMTPALVTQALTEAAAAAPKILFVNFDGNGPVIRRSSGISSVVLISTGLYRINFLTPFADADYAVAGFANFPNGNRAGLVTQNINHDPQPGYVEITTANSTAGTASTFSYVNVIIAG